MVGIRVTNGKFKDVLSGKKTTIFADNKLEVAVGDKLYLNESVKVNFNKCGYWYTGRIAVVKVVAVNQFNNHFPPHVRFEFVDLWKH